MRRILILFLTLLLLWTVTMLVNDALAGLRVYVFAGALFVSFAALTQPWRTGLIASMLGGLVCDANSPVPFGLHLLLFSAAHIALFQMRGRVPRDDALAGIVVVLLANLALFLVFSLILVHGSPAPGALWRRLIADLLCSQVFVILVTPWFFALQARAIAFAGVPREDAA